MADNQERVEEKKRAPTSEGYESRYRFSYRERACQNIDNLALQYKENKVKGEKVL